LGDQFPQLQSFESRQFSELSGMRAAAPVEESEQSITGSRVINAVFAGVNLNFRACHTISSSAAAFAEIVFRLGN